MSEEVFILTDPGELVSIPAPSLKDVFVDPDGLTAVMDKIEAMLDTLELSADTPKGRKEIASIAYKVAQSKTFLDNLGKDLVAEMKELPKKIDENRRLMRERMDKLRDKARAKLDAWEAEEARKAEEAKRVAEAELLRQEIEHLHEFGLLQNEKMDALRAAAKLEEERAAERRAQEQREREAQLVREAEERVRAEAQARADAEAAAARKREEDALAQIEAERQKLQREQEQRRLDQERAAAELKAAEERRQREVEAAAKAEADRLEQERAAQAAEDERRANHARHRARVEREVWEGLLNAASNGLDPLDSSEMRLVEDILEAVKSGKIPHLAIAY